MYLELGVDASHIQTRFPTDPTQEHYIKTFKQHIYGTNTLYSNYIPITLQFMQKGPSRSKTPHLLKITNQDSVCPKSVSLAVTNDIEYFFLLLRLLRCFNSAGSQSYTDQPHKKTWLGSPIRQSWVPKMYAPRPSLSQLTTTLIGNLSQAIPQTV